MASYPDLSLYRYRTGDFGDRVLNVGWLDRSEPFPVGDVPAEFVSRLWAFCGTRVMALRGVHYCTVCPSFGPDDLWTSHRGSWRMLGSAEVWAFDTTGTAYAAPNLVFHYVVAHGYRPPSAFVDALVAGPGPDDATYFDQLGRLGASWTVIRATSQRPPSALFRTR